MGQFQREFRKWNTIARERLCEDTMEMDIEQSERKERERESGGKQKRREEQINGRVTNYEYIKSACKWNYS